MTSCKKGGKYKYIRLGAQEHGGEGRFFCKPSKEDPAFNFKNCNIAFRLLND